MSKVFKRRELAGQVDGTMTSESTDLIVSCFQNPLHHLQSLEARCRVPELLDVKSWHFP